MSENKSAKTPADGSMVWSCQCGRPYTVTCISSKPQKQWVGLTDEEKEKLVEAFYGTDIQRLEAIEAKLKEKNT